MTEQTKTTEAPCNDYVRADLVAAKDAEIERLRAALNLADAIIYRMACGTFPWSVEMMVGRLEAIKRDARTRISVEEIAQ
jgi:hypothetical protein